MICARVSRTRRDGDGSSSRPSCACSSPRGSRRSMRPRSCRRRSSGREPKRGRPGRASRTASARKPRASRSRATSIGPSRDPDAAASEAARPLPRTLPTRPARAARMVGAQRRDRLDRSLARWPGRSGSAARPSRTRGRRGGSSRGFRAPAADTPKSPLRGLVRHRVERRGSRRLGAASFPCAPATSIAELAGAPRVSSSGPAALPRARDERNFARRCTRCGARRIDAGAQAPDASRRGGC